jgi:membrane protease YdiL (CAAX protease family)
VTPRIALELAVFVAVLVADAFGLVPITLTLGLLPAVWILMRLAREPWSAIGFALPPRPGRALLLGIAAGLAMELLAVHVTSPALGRWLGAEPEHSELDAILRDDLGALVALLALSWALAAFGEELCFRGFLMDRVARSLGGTRAAWIASLVLASALFGWLHAEQNAAGAVQEALSGFLLGVLFLATGRNLTVPIVAHGVSNSLALVLIPLGRYTGQA